MKKIVLQLLFALIICTTTTAQYNVITSTELPEMIRGLKSSSVSVEIIEPYTGKNTPLGSGVLISKDGNMYAVTNYHVIEIGFNDSVMKNRIIAVGLNLFYNKIYKRISSLKVDKENDLAILDLTDSLEIVVRSNHVDSTLNTQYVVVGINMFQPSDSIKEGEQILTIGYPLGIGTDLTGNSPVSRTGIVAQRVNKKTNTFILDTSVSHGNSGSPVFNASNAKFMGIISSYRNDNSTIIDNKGKAIALVESNSDLSVAISADAILKLLNEK